MKTAFALLIAGATALFAVDADSFIRDPSLYEKILLPIYNDEPVMGSHGARWQTRLWLGNDSSEPVDAFPLTPQCTSSAVCFHSVRPKPAFGPFQTGYNISILAGPTFQPFRVTVPESPEGVFLYVERGKVTSLSAILHVADTNKRAPSLGTRIPIVRESDFFSDRRSVLGVRIDRGSRLAVRIYDPSSQAGGFIRLRIREMTARVLRDPLRIEPPRLFLDDVLAFDYDPAADRCTLLRCPEVAYKPAIVSITDLLESYPQLIDAFSSPFGVRIEFEPLSPAQQYWPLVTVTDNESNHVTVYTVN